MPPSATLPCLARILIVDDSPLVRAGLRAVLESSTSRHPITICGEAGSAGEALEKAQLLTPDLVLLDIRLPDGHGYEVCRTLRSELPQTRVLMLTAFTSETFIYESITAGADGYLMKEIEPEGLIRSINEVLEGRSVLSDQITDKVVAMMRTGGPDTPQSHLRMLSPQEHRVLEQVAQGRTNKEIADHLKLADNTVKNYLSSVFDKLKVRRRSQAAAIWTQQQDQ